MRRPFFFFVLRSAFCVLLSLPLAAETFKTSDGVTLHYTRIGKGRPRIVLLSGGPGFSGEYMKPIAERLKKRHAFVVLDQRGTGRSVLANPDATTLAHARLVADIDELRQALKAEQITLVGHSWGGILSMLYASAHPERVRALLLIDSGGPTTQSVMRFAANHAARMTEEDSAKVREWSDAERRKANPRRAVLEITKARTPPYFAKREHAQAFMDALTEESFNDAVFWPIVGQMNAAFDLREGLKRVNAPVLVIHGRQDPLETAQEVHAALAGARLEMIDEAGHFPWIEQPERFYALTDAFLREIVQR